LDGLKGAIPRKIVEHLTFTEQLIKLYEKKDKSDYLFIGIMALTAYRACDV
jgi:integrase